MNAYHTQYKIGKYPAWEYLKKHHKQRFDGEYKSSLIFSLKRI